MARDRSIALLNTINPLVWMVSAVLLLAPDVCAAHTASKQLEDLAAQVHERALDLFPVTEIFSRGSGPRKDDLELNLGDEHRERQRAHNRWILEELKSIPAGDLSPTEKITRALLDRRARDALEWLSYPFHQHSAFIHLMPGIPFVLVRVVGSQPFRNEADYRAWFRRAQLFPAFFASMEDVMREGVAAGVTTPRVLVERALEQLDALVPEDAPTSPLWRPMLRFPTFIGDDARKSLEADYRRLLAEEVLPALRHLADFVRNFYLPQARSTDGLSALPKGNDMYRLAVRYETTTDSTPEEVHELGLAEVRRIQANYLAAAQSAGFDGRLSQVRAWLRSKPENYPFTSAEQVIEHLQHIYARIEPQLPKLFGRLPKAPFEIRLTDPAIAASAPPQYYAPTKGRPGIFAMPVVNPRNVLSPELPALLAHEGVPGHHLESGIKVENDVPEFRRTMWVNAFGEGWALYAESLGVELGLYEQPLELLGRYSFELLRACRLVVDTGLHLKGWARAQAIRYLVEECDQAEDFATNEVLRYMAWPGQALGYKLGELTILELRAKAKKRLGARFDLRAFHDALLGEGHMPMNMLRQRMDKWIDAQGM
jgi:uncharacterized protein (DUF885 family)